MAPKKPKFKKNIKERVKKKVIEPANADGNVRIKEESEKIQKIIYKQFQRILYIVRSKYLRVAIWFETLYHHIVTEHSEDFFKLCVL